MKVLFKDFPHFKPHPYLLFVSIAINVFKSFLYRRRFNGFGPFSIKASIPLKVAFDQGNLPRLD